MIEDMRLAVNGKADVDFVGRMGGLLIPPEELSEEVLVLEMKLNMVA